MRQNTNLIKARGLFNRNGSVLGNSCIYSRIDSGKYELELTPLTIRSLSPTINSAYEANLDFKTGSQRLIPPLFIGGLWQVLDDSKFSVTGSCWLRSRFVTMSAWNSPRETNGFRMEWLESKHAKILSLDENRVEYIFLILGNVTNSQISTANISFILLYIDIAFRNKMEESNQTC